MKTLLLSLLLLASVNASAKTIKLFSFWAGFADDVQTTFVVNEELGRAWVNVVTIHDLGDESDEVDHFVKVEGLSFDKATQEVVYSGGEFKVTCARYVTRGRGIFRSTRLINSDACRFVESREVRSIDDGFYVRTKKYEVVSLEIKL
jgi:hypothetical protein